MLDRDAAPGGTLLCHLSRGNAQWRTPAGNALVIFLGADAYVTPRWYSNKTLTGEVVPTWNYIAVHATVRCACYAPDDYLAKQFCGIVGIEIRITRIDGKWKMGQNASENDMESVTAGLDASGDPTDRETARVMRELNAMRARSAG